MSKFCAHYKLESYHHKITPVDKWELHTRATNKGEMQ